MKNRSLRTTGLLFLGLILGGCAPSADTCRSLMPVPGEVVLTTTPEGRTGCSCTNGGVVVIVQPERDGPFGWRRGSIWIDGEAVSSAEFAERFERAQAIRAMKDAGARAGDAAATAAKGAAAATKAFFERLRRK